MKRRVALFVLAAGLVGALVVVSGVVPIAASSGHFAVTEWFLHFAMKRSVATHAIGVEVPELDDDRLVTIGAGHYEHGCRYCHGAPGARMPRVPVAMTPHPPRLDDAANAYDAAELFYIVRHGVKFTGMPAWPAEGRDDEVWAVVAFLRAWPKLDDAGYRELIGAPSAASDAPAVVVEACARCHGIEGDGRSGIFPRLGGQREAYLRGSLEAYATGARASGIMAPIAAELTDEAIAAASKWYASRAGLSAADRGGPELVAAGAPDRLIGACRDCHDGDKHPAYPYLAGQSRAYLEQQLVLFRSGQRGGTGFAKVMKNAAAHALEDDEIHAVAEHYGSVTR